MRKGLFDRICLLRFLLLRGLQIHTSIFLEPLRERLRECLRECLRERLRECLRDRLRHPLPDPISVIWQLPRLGIS